MNYAFDLRRLWMRCIAIAAVGFVAGCATQPTRVTSVGDMSAQQLASVRAYFDAMTRRDDVYETATGMRRGDPNFDAVKSSLGDIYRDPVVQDWMLVQFANDRDGFAKAWAQTYREGLMRVDDAGGIRLLRAIGSIMSRLDEAQCRQFEQSSRSGFGQGGFNALLRFMTDTEIRDLFGGIQQVMRAGINRAPARAVPTGLQVGAAMGQVESLTRPAPGTTQNGCQQAGRMFTSIERLDPPGRGHLLTSLLALAGAGGARSP